ncbi:hypothetical protein Micbo1qcDRAFT_167531 [Microdochium bolleyi]|uniref:Uncharacterized protein n=1 Tax=Microdochium bolleyi TaxID=196109 RepID=A0A136IRS0_9PEZI|nr:hypothetical protein Micbo1qcDRAFT_167531 [Microdochium bolleyi]
MCSLTVVGEPRTLRVYFASASSSFSSATCCARTAACMARTTCSGGLGGLRTEKPCSAGSPGVAAADAEAALPSLFPTPASASVLDENCRSCESLLFLADFAPETAGKVSPPVTSLLLIRLSLPSAPVSLSSAVDLLSLLAAEDEVSVDVVRIVVVELRPAMSGVGGAGASP